MTQRRITLLIALGLTIAPVGAWLSTGRETFTKKTKFVETVREPDPDDFLDFARADDDGLIRETERREGFWFGMLPGGMPRPGAWLDPTTLSVVSVAAPVWAIAGLICIVIQRRSRRGGDA